MAKKILLFLFSFLFIVVANGQVITGRVVDKKTGEPVSFAAIYFNGTFVGTTSDIDGFFELDVTENASMPLSVSCMGYYSHTLSDYSSGKPITIHLEPKEFQLDEITITARSQSRKRKSALRVFKREFLGSSVNAGSCEILNPDALLFDYGTSGDTITAYAEEPLEILNEALGYRISYYLDKFEYYRPTRSFLYQGNIIFEEDLVAGSSANESARLEKRLQAYIGSRMHFLRSLWHDELQKSEYTMTDSNEKSVSYNHIVIQEMGDIQDKERQVMKYLSYPFPITILHEAKASTMTLINQRVYFDETGYHSTGIIWEGEMLKQRIADALPYEYGR